MAKESASSRIPRLDGVSRIPQPGNILVRPQKLNTRATQILRPPAVANANLRAPNTLAPTGKSTAALGNNNSNQSNAIKKSSSGDRINNVVSLMSCRTNTALKKLFSKPKRSTSQNASAAPKSKVAEPNQLDATQTVTKHDTVSMAEAGTPRLFTRSDTFIRGASQLDLLSITKADILAQSTPAAVKTHPICETTQLLGNKTRHVLYTTQSLDCTARTPPCFSETITLEGKPPSALPRGLAMDTTRCLAQGFSNANDVASPELGFKALNETQCVSTPLVSGKESTTKTANLTKTFQATTQVGKTVCVDSPIEQLKQQLTLTTQNVIKCQNQLNDRTVVSKNLENYADLGSPATNATFSTPGSTDNLIMLEDISIPPGLDMDITLQADEDAMNVSLEALAPDKAQLKLPLNSTLNSNRLLDLTDNALSPTKQKQKHLFNVTHQKDVKNNTQLLYMSQLTSSATITPERSMKFLENGHNRTPIPVHLLSPLLLKGAKSDIALPTRTPDDELNCEPMDVDTTLTSIGTRTEEFFAQQQEEPNAGAISLQDVNNLSLKPKSRYSFGLDLTESTLDCSIELIDVSLSSTALSQPNVSAGFTDHILTQSASTQQLQQLRKQNSFDLDESLGILTPDQMKEFLDSATTNTNNLELPLVPHATNNDSNNKLSLHHMRIDQTPSPEELPLDPVEVKTDISDLLLLQQHQQQPQSTAYIDAQQRLVLHQQQSHHLQTSSLSTEPVSQHTDITDLSKTDHMSKSNVSRISTSFITSVTSVTSLDTGYQGDGEMSRPASRGAGDHSPSNAAVVGRRGGHVSRQPSFNQQQVYLPPIRRQDPMTDSDFFTESDADDIFNRGDRRAQVIDGQLYGPTLGLTASSVFITEDPQMEDSCMESSGIFTDVENRCEEDLAQMRRQDTQIVATNEEISSPDVLDAEGDDSTETVKSKRSARNSQHAANGGDSLDTTPPTALGQGQLSCSQTSSTTIQSSFSNDRLSAATLSNRTSYCSVDGSAVNVDAKSFSSLEEAFCTEEEQARQLSHGSTITATSSAIQQRSKSSNTGSSVSCCEAQTQHVAVTVAATTAAAVQRVTSPRKHASLSSLCHVNAVYGAKTEILTSLQKATVPATGSCTVSRAVSNAASTASLSGSAKSLNNSSTGGKSKHTPRGTKSTPKSGKLRAVSATQNNGSATPPLRIKQHTPNKWDAVMNKIASNKALIKKNYNDVKSKVSTRMTVNTGSGGGVSRNVSGTGTPNSTASTPTVRRSPTARRIAPKVLNAAVGSKAAVATSSSSPSPTAPPTDTGTSGLLSPQVKRSPLNAAKRGRSYSKDSQKSSQSDLSLTSGSPKLLAKTPLRAAKKRDVRNLSISPTDLGPPPKAQQTINGTATRPKSLVAAALSQKRYSPNAATTNSAASTTASTPTGVAGNGSLTVANSSGKGVASATVKKLGSITNSHRRLELKTLAKSPLKDHNRIIGNPPQATAPSTVAAAAAATKNGSKPETPTELHDIGNGVVAPQHLHNNNNISNASASQKGTAAAAAATRTSTQTPSPILGPQAKKVSSSLSGAAVLLDKQKSGRKLIFQKQQTRSTENAPSTPTPTTATAKDLDASELQRLKLLNRHSCNGRLNYESIEKQLQQAEFLQLQHDKGVEALGVLLQYLVYDLDAFACPTLKNESAKAKENLCKTLQLLDEAKSSCTELQEQLCEKEAYYVQREEELQELHRCELEKAERNLSEFQQMAKEQRGVHESQLAAKDAEQKRALDSYRLEMDNKMAQKRQQLAEVEERERALQERLKASELSEQQLREKLQETEHSYEERSQAAAEREREQGERMKQLSKELDMLRSAKEQRERELRDKLNLSQDEIAVLRYSQRSLNESSSSASAIELRGSSPRNANSMSASTLEVSRLQSEADSLRCVLELKQKEISKLTKQNEELLRDAEERVALQGKISLLESRNEMLQSELGIKSDKEKEFLRQMDDIQKAFNHETVKRTRLSYDNEALQWQLKQRSEQLHIVEAKLQELSSQEPSLNATNPNSSLSSASRTFSSSNQANGFSLTAIQVDEVSPPVSPIIKGVIEKNDSVSWVLEMDDETPEVAASKMVKRAGSFRSVERSPSMRRQLSVSANAAYGMGQSTSNGPIPLSQSMSATSVIRPHSSAEAASAEFSNRSHSRIRSKSVSVKSTEPVMANASSKSKKLLRQNSIGNPRKHELGVGAPTGPICASSPYNGVRPRTSTMIQPDCDKDEVFLRRSSAATAANAGAASSSAATAQMHKLITCDSSALNSGERLELRALPSHPSMHGFKARKKCQEIQESAGEAMVSGTNSEDEGCSASSDEVVSSVSTSSATSGSTSSLNQMKNAQMSLEEVLLLGKINSLNGTPMEMSWSDDAEVFANGSTV